MALEIEHIDKVDGKKRTILSRHTTHMKRLFLSTGKKKSLEIGEEKCVFLLLLTIFSISISFWFSLKYLETNIAQRNMSTILNDKRKKNQFLYLFLHFRSVAF